MAKLIQKRENPDTHVMGYYLHYDGCKLSAGVDQWCVLCLVYVDSEKMNG